MYPKKEISRWRAKGCLEERGACICCVVRSERGVRIARLAGLLFGRLGRVRVVESFGRRGNDGSSHQGPTRERPPLCPMGLPTKAAREDTRSLEKHFLEDFVRFMEQLARLGRLLDGPIASQSLAPRVARKPDSDRVAQSGTARDQHTSALGLRAHVSIALSKSTSECSRRRTVPRRRRRVWRRDVQWPNSESGVACIFFFFFFFRFFCVVFFSFSFFKIRFFFFSFSFSSFFSSRDAARALRGRAPLLPVRRLARVARHDAHHARPLKRSPSVTGQKSSLAFSTPRATKF